MGGPRRVRLASSRRGFGDTVDYVLKHAPYRVMVAATEGGGNRLGGLPPDRAPARAAIAVLGIALLVSTAWHGSSAINYRRAMFIGLGSGRIYLLRKRR